MNQDIRLLGLQRWLGTRRTLTGLVFCLALAGAWPGASGGASFRSDCKAGPTTIGGATVRVWCGPAKATVHVAGKTYHFAYGLCQKTEGFSKGSKVLAVNIGTLTLPPSAPKLSYFGVLTDKAKGGTYTNQAVSWQVPGKGFAVLTNKVVVSANLKKGSFKGKATVRINGKIKDAGVASGSWNC
jgi:hypothetical protein